MRPFLLAAVLLIGAQQAPTTLRDPNQHLERTSFQTGGPYDPRVDIRSDVAMVYGITGNFQERMRGWKERGYIIHLMTGVSWGEYQDYFSGRWDGKSHADEAQMDRFGREILHGPTVPYVAPSADFGRYLCEGVKRAMDAGAEAVHLEEPEFWVRAGYSGSFKREWQAYYGEPWIPPHSSPDAQYRASKLKYFLYRRALQQVFDFVQEENRRTGRNVRCYVPTHSMINYAHWRIVSPEQSLVLLNGCDGYIGQVWTGTSRTPNRYRGELRERTFDTAFLEYGVLHNLVRSTGRRMYYLNDPVEDNPDHTWEDYRRNWESTLVASLLWPDVWRFEVTPWPERPFIGKYPQEGSAERVGISPEYATELLTVFNALNHMKQTRIEWSCGTRGVGVLVSDTMMFHRGEPAPGDPHLGSFYGLALPLLKSGAPVQPVQIENLHLPDYLKPYKVLFLTYEGQKPPSPDAHKHLAEWVRKGGSLVLVDDGSDPYNGVREWWNTGARRYASPMEHLREVLASGAAEKSRAGRGHVFWIKRSPAALSRARDGADVVLAAAREAVMLAGGKWEFANHLVLRRGPFVVVAGLEEAEGGEARHLAGRYVDLFDARLRVVTSFEVRPGTRRLLVDLDRLPRDGARIVASASQTVSTMRRGSTIRYQSLGPIGTLCATRVRLPSAPRRVMIDGREAGAEWDEASSTALIVHPNEPSGVRVEIGW